MKLSTHCSWAPIFPQKLVDKDTIFLDGYISKRYFPGPGEKMFLVLKLARDFLSLQKDLHTFQKDKEGTYDYKFSTVCVLRKGLGWWEEIWPLIAFSPNRPCIL